ncbi:acryloyl-CoA reductase [Paenibacillus sp. N1-5-1-14]|uniref:acrylyl-CoA reductase family protein n=1 Tax=Paenibacillus radicibacter TaxID=2972488 RepID=UPI00215930C3|nr:acryloyl-CoA reductase [Paenibacillus radicibacter]MCR8644986.1 acryloyl-CoA reductase [Paenibacillus radicibacter]
MTTTFRALVVDKNEADVSLDLKNLPLSDLPEGDVTIRVAYSSINYKDGLAGTSGGGILRSYPMIPGIDLAGTVMESHDTRFREGDPVLVTGYGLGVSHFGGYAEVARVPAGWVVPLPSGLTLQEAMALGTAGFTAALSVHRLLQHGLAPEDGPVLVTGATGGVGSVAVALLAGLGYEVAAVTGKDTVTAHDYLRGLGAQVIVPREEIARPIPGALARERWAAAVDPVGGEMLANVLKTTRYGGAVAASGLAGGASLASLGVYPFILRGVALLGIDSVQCPYPLRSKIWNLLAGEWKPIAALEATPNEVTLEELPSKLTNILEGQGIGRNIVRIT